MPQGKAQNMDYKTWFKQAKYGMMIHFGLYALPAGEWKGARMPCIGEWAQSYFRIPRAEYAELAKVFNPILFNADEWVTTAKEAGMKVCAVYDDTSADMVEEMKAVCDMYIYNFTELL